MRILAATFAILLLATPAFAYSGRWHVAEDLSAHACYRVTDFTARPGWKDLGTFATFRMAGVFIWSHRDICQSSPVFH